MNIRAIFYLALLASFLCIGGCDKLFPEDDDPDVEEPEDPDVPVGDLSSLKSIRFSSAKTARLLVINTKANWTVAADADWLQFTQSTGLGKTGVLIGAQKNPILQRKATITITSGDRQHLIAVSQDGASQVTVPVGSESIDLVLVEGTTFTLKEYSSYYSHEVKLDSFYIATVETTNAFWKAVTGGLPYDSMDVAIRNSKTLTALELPVSYISYYDIVQRFLPALKQKTQLDFRMPTEAEWEFAARGGKLSKGYIYAGSSAVNDVAWTYANAQSRKHQGAQLQPNELGLYDMSGNLNEWCSDWYDSYPSGLQVNPKGPETGTLKVIRGGNYQSSGLFGETNECRVNYRYYLIPSCHQINFPGTVYENRSYRCETVGFRLVMVVPK
jgi:formylglycine-generating enzyme required for sulfatase activity